MSPTYARIHIHVIFSTKERQKASGDSAEGDRRFP